MRIVHFATDFPLTIMLIEYEEVSESITAPVDKLNLRCRCGTRYVYPCDVMRYLRDHEIVRQIRIEKKAHPRYELTEVGQHFQRLLLQVEAL